MNYQRLPYPSFRTPPYTIHDVPGNFQYCPHHYQGLHFCHPAHVCASRATHTIQQSANSTLTTHTERHPKKSSNLPSSKSSLTNNFTNHAIHLQLAHQPATLIHQHPNMGSLLLGFFGFLRVGEFTIPSDDGDDEECQLSLADVSVDNHNNPQLLRVKIKQSKIDPFRKGVDIYLGATGTTLCPIKAILSYLALRSKHCNGPLFISEDGRSLTRQSFSSLLQILLLRLGFDSTQYNTHSCHIGAATTAAQANIQHTTCFHSNSWKVEEQCIPAVHQNPSTRACLFFKI